MRQGYATATNVVRTGAKAVGAVEGAAAVAKANNGGKMSAFGTAKNLLSAGWNYAGYRNPVYEGLSEGKNMMMDHRKGLLSHKIQPSRQTPGHAGNIYSSPDGSYYGLEDPYWEKDMLGEYELNEDNLLKAQNAKEAKEDPLKEAKKEAISEGVDMGVDNAVTSATGSKILGTIAGAGAGKLAGMAVEAYESSKTPDEGTKGKTADGTGVTYQSGGKDGAGWYSDDGSKVTNSSVQTGDGKVYMPESMKGETLDGKTATYQSGGKDGAGWYSDKGEKITDSPVMSASGQSCYIPEGMTAKTSDGQAVTYSNTGTSGAGWYTSDGKMTSKPVTLGNGVSYEPRSTPQNPTGTGNRMTGLDKHNLG